MSIISYLILLTRLVEASITDWGNIYNRKAASSMARSFISSIRRLPPSDRLRCLPGVYMIGAPGCGTIDLYFQVNNTLNSNKGKVNTVRKAKPVLLSLIKFI